MAAKKLLLTVLCFSAVLCLVHANKRAQHSQKIITPLSCGVSVNDVPTSCDTNLQQVFKLLLVDNDTDRVYIGSTECLYVLDRNLIYINSTKLSLTGSDLVTCEAFFAQEKEFRCKNYITYAHKVDETSVRVCGTYGSLNPRCYTCQSDGTGCDDGYTTQFMQRTPTENFTVTVAMDGSQDYYYLGGLESYTSPDKILAKVVVNLAGDVSTADPETDNNLENLLKEPTNFVGSIERGAFIYFFFRETAIEYETMGQIIYSRVARVCKNDEGGVTNPLNDEFTTFLKTRLMCSVGADFPFIFNEIQDVVKSPNVEDVIYGLFTTSSAGSSSTAICRYNMIEIDELFNKDNRRGQETLITLWQSVPIDPEDTEARRSCSTPFRFQEYDYLEDYTLLNTNAPNCGLGTTCDDYSRQTDEALAVFEGIRGQQLAVFSESADSFQVYVGTNNNTIYGAYISASEVLITRQMEIEVDVDLVTETQIANKWPFGVGYLEANDRVIYGTLDNCAFRFNPDIGKGVECSPTTFGNASFPSGTEGDVVDSSETCPIYTTMGGTPIARAVCAQDTIFGELAWNITMYLNDCGPLRGTDQVVADIIEKGVTNETVIEALEVVLEVSDMEIDEGDIANIANIISNSTALQSGDPEITTLTASIISNFAERDEEELSAVEENTGAITQILESFEEQLNNLDISDGQTYTALEMNVAVQVTSVEPADFLSGLTLSASSTSSDLSQTNITLNAGDSPDQEEVLTGTRVSIPSSVLSGLINEVGSESGVRLALSIFSTPALFFSQRIRRTNNGQSSFNRTVNSLVIGLTLGGEKMRTLGEDIVFKYTPLQSGFQDPECVFWDFEDTLDWSSRGCRQITSSGSANGEITCSCDHLTNFAVLMDIYAERVEALRIISIIGCAISIVCLIIILITYLSNKNLHVHQSQKIFMCLCGNLLCLYFTFLIMSALDSHPDHTEVAPVPCGILAALVHFFTLSSLAWMGVEGINTYLIVVRVFDAYIPRFMLKASLVAWGGSGLIVLLTGLAAQGNYAATDYCFLQKWSSIGGLLIPIALILLTNIVIFGLVVRRLIKSANVTSNTSNNDSAGRKASIERIKNAVSVLLLLGLTWITGYLTLIDTTSQVTQTLFIVFNSLQGFFIFILYCARNPVVRAYWARVCGCGQDSSKTSTRANQRTSQVISSTKTKSTSENDYENPSFDDKEYTDLDFSKVEKSGDPTKSTSSDGKGYTDLDLSKVEDGGDPTKSTSVVYDNPTFDGKEDVDPAYEVCII